MNVWRTIKNPPWRTIVPGVGFLMTLWLSYSLWTPGLDVRDGRHDRKRNAIWLAHGWLGGDQWFQRNRKTNEISKYRDPGSIHALAEKLQRHHVTDVYPHLCPTDFRGHLPETDRLQTERFLDAFGGFRVIPWIGGANGGDVRLHDKRWRSVFTQEVKSLLDRHPRLAGIHLNIEPLPNGDTNFLVLLEELRSNIPHEKLISIAAYPPPTRWHPYPDVHWDERYFREVARRSDQLAVMMYDAGQRMPKSYQRLMAAWTEDVLAWSGEKSVLLGIPTYEDAGVNYHFPDVENIENALLGIHRGLSRTTLPKHFQGVAIYSDWETSADEWSYFSEHFLSPQTAR